MLLARHGRTARTLVKEGPLRLTIMGIAAGGVLPAHRTDAHVTIHLLEGEVTFTARDREYPLHIGDVLVIAPSERLDDIAAKHLSELPLPIRAMLGGLGVLLLAAAAYQFSKRRRLIPVR